MEEAIERAVGRVIQTMHENLSEQLTVDDMARTAMFSKFHFSRVFRQATGISPGRFLSALRLQEAKRLLISTSLSVADISNRVGYTSVGTFSSRFKSSVGIAPTTYRQYGGFATRIVPDSRSAGAELRTATIQGEVWAPATAQLGLIFVGLFPTPVPQGRPIRCTVLHRPGPYLLEDVPTGSWHLLSHAVSPGEEEIIGDPYSRAHAPSVAGVGPITIGTDTRITTADLHLRPAHPLDPPVLMALLDVRKVALRTAG